MNLYVLVEWPESQDFMEEPWFEEEAILAEGENVGSSAYFIPLDKFSKEGIEMFIKPYV